MLHKNTIQPGTLELLKILQSDEVLKSFYLAGGTSLALQIGHRQSVDLDFFTTDDFDVNFLLEFLESNYNFHSDFTANNTLKGFIDSIKVDFISHKYPLVKNIRSLENIKLYSIEDIAAMKLNAIAGNGTRSKDFIDLYFILNEYSVSQLIDFYSTKYKTRNTFHVVKSMVYFDDVSTEDWPLMILEKNLNLEKIKRTIETKVNETNLEL
ncbi:nucleotidyl transferase AbiEii/AbiGii toxin family protein [Marinilabiliaceae bacterium ANBcel2]|nr:nucleotidyl transferase AbiEii/AbiGii toxin family protein [Marinilabiliaceae bacterium ANBcel2]